MKTIQFAKTTRSYTQHIAAPADEVFPLLCPVREMEWLEDFGCEIIYSESGLAEQGCVFRTQAPDGPETIWMMVQHDREKGVVDFVRVTEGLVATRLNIELEPTNNRTTNVHITYTFIPTSEEGATLVRTAHSAEAFNENLQWWERSMNHYLETGKMLRSSGA